MLSNGKIVAVRKFKKLKFVKIMFNKSLVSPFEMIFLERSAQKNFQVDRKKINMMTLENQL